MFANQPTLHIGRFLCGFVSAVGLECMLIVRTAWYLLACLLLLWLSVGVLPREVHPPNIATLNRTSLRAPLWRLPLLNTSESPCKPCTCLGITDHQHKSGAFTVLTEAGPDVCVLPAPHHCLFAHVAGPTSLQLSALRNMKPWGRTWMPSSTCSTATRYSEFFLSAP